MSLLSGKTCREDHRLSTRYIIRIFVIVIIEPVQIAYQDSPTVLGTARQNGTCDVNGCTGNTMYGDTEIVQLDQDLAWTEVRETRGKDVQSEYSTVQYSTIQYSTVQ